MKRTPIRNAYDAWWFLYEHPKLNCRTARLVPKEEKPDKGCRRRQIRDAMPWAEGKRYWIIEHPVMEHAIEHNLDIFYALVDEKRRVNKDASKNKFIECWLELGPVEYVVSDGHLHLQYSHDINLDCGAATFDEALVKLAKLVRRHYGDYRRPKE